MLARAQQLSRRFSFPNSSDLGLRAVMPFLRETLVGLEQNLEDRPPVRGRQRFEVGVVVPPAENLEQAVIHISLGRFRKRIERLRVNEVAAGVAEDALLQIKVPER